jgi:hypothetical protein
MNKPRKGTPATRDFYNRVGRRRASSGFAVGRYSVDLSLDVDDRIDADHGRTCIRSTLPGG